jgi:hypothetical protein
MTGACTLKELRVGDKVCRKESRGVLSKQVPRNSGPYIVHQVLSNHKVTLAKLDGELAFTHPVPVSELVYIPERVGLTHCRPRSPFGQQVSGFSCSRTKTQPLPWDLGLKPN